jgi:hypothetical protein
MSKLLTPLVLPSDYDEMESFIINNKVKLTEHVVSAVQHAVSNDIPSVELFSFKDSDFIVILEYPSFKDNIENIFKFYVETEQYEFCDRVSKLKKILEKHEQEKQKKRHKSKNSSK